MACLMERRVRLGPVFVWLIVAAGCGFPRPSPVGGEDDGGAGDGTPMSVCAADQPLRCDGNNLVRCNSGGTAEVTETCSLGCGASPLHCNVIDPSNGLARYLDMAAGEPDLDLGMTAVISTSDGTVMVDGKPVMVRSALLAQTNAPAILVFIVHGLTGNDVTISGDLSGSSGGNAFALVSNGDIRIGGIFNASARVGSGGPGVYNDANCKGGVGVAGPASSLSGTGGGGFGTAGGTGGSASTIADSATGGSGGKPTGTSTLTPLRGGCDSGAVDDLHPRAVGSGGGAIQLVSHTKISIIGVVAANGSSLAGGGSGGGILIEAPIVEVTGSVVANGAGGNGGCFFATRPGENGRLDATPALGGTCSSGEAGAGGNGAAGAIGATGGVSIHLSNADAALAGHGGGGVGRIRINSTSGGFHRAGLFSPDPSTGAIAIR
jgi:hypothetical protein